MQQPQEVTFNPSLDSPSGFGSSPDIVPLLHGWDYEPGAVNVRKVTGLDGRPKLQLRLDLGLLQMELTGRPDGSRPYGHESLLEYHEAQLDRYLTHNGTDLGFHLTPDECRQLRDEAAQYYHRYLSLFVLEEYDGVVRDTGRNLRTLDLCERYALDEGDRRAMEPQRPYVTMMHHRSLAAQHDMAGRHRQALHELKKGVKRIRRFFTGHGHPEAALHCGEMKVLRRLVRQVREKLPRGPVDDLRRQLRRALDGERYEEAAKLRDEIARVQPRPSRV